MSIAAAGSENASVGWSIVLILGTWLAFAAAGARHGYTKLRDVEAGRIDQAGMGWLTTILFFGGLGMLGYVVRYVRWPGILFTLVTLVFAFGMANAAGAWLFMVKRIVKERREPSDPTT